MTAGDDDAKHWTRAAVLCAMVDAMRLLHRTMRDPLPTQPRSLHPEIVRNLADAIAAESNRDKREWGWSKPRVFDATAITRAEEALAWVPRFIASESDRKLVWTWIAARAFQHEWSVTADISARFTGKEAAAQRVRMYRQRDSLLQLITDKLNQKGISVFSNLEGAV